MMMGAIFPRSRGKIFRSGVLNRQPLWPDVAKASIKDEEEDEGAMSRDLMNEGLNPEVAVNAFNWLSGPSLTCDQIPSKHHVILFIPRNDNSNDFIKTVMDRAIELLYSSKATEALVVHTSLYDCPGTSLLQAFTSNLSDAHSAVIQFPHLYPPNSTFTFAGICTSGYPESSTDPEIMALALVGKCLCSMTFSASQSSSSSESSLSLFPLNQEEDKDKGDKGQLNVTLSDLAISNLSTSSCPLFKRKTAKSYTPYVISTSISYLPSLIEYLRARS